MKLRWAIAFAVGVSITGCTTRSISDSGYSHGYYGGNRLYQGELSEFDLLGVRAGSDTSEEDIQSALSVAPERKLLAKGDRILLIQSGAIFPDEEMLAHLEETFSVTLFTGVPDEDPADTDSYSKSLRLAAAKAGIGTIVAYWGILESGTVNLATKTVSWVPIVGRAVPDKTQKMRIRLKVAVVDVATGQWEIFAPETFDDKAVSGRINRESVDQAQVAQLKSAAYESAAKELVARFVR